MNNSSIFYFKMAQTHFPNQRLKHDIEIVNEMFVLDILKTSKHILLLQIQLTQVCLDYRLQDRTWNPFVSLRQVLGSFSASLKVGIIHNRLCNSTWGLHLKFGFLGSTIRQLHIKDTVCLEDLLPYVRWRVAGIRKGPSCCWWAWVVEAGRTAGISSVPGWHLC